MVKTKNWGAFASNGSLLNTTELLAPTTTTVTNEVLGNSCTTTVIITIDHGPNFPPDVIKVSITGPCDDSGD